MPLVAVAMILMMVIAADLSAGEFEPAGTLRPSRIFPERAALAGKIVALRSSTWTWNHFSRFRKPRCDA